MRQLIDGYALGVADARIPGDPLSATDLGALLVALNQGASLLMLSGSHVDATLLQSGIERLLNPGSPEAPESAVRSDDPLLRVDQAEARIAAWVRREHVPEHDEQHP